MTFRRYTTAWSCGALLVVVSLSQTLCKTPLLRIIELNICRSYYQSHDPSVIDPDGFVDEKRCKVIPVQKQLANINGYNIFFTALMEFLTAFPYTSLSERWDRRVILSANVAGGFTALFYTMCICYFPQSISIKMIWLQCVFRMFGGGDSVLLSLANALIAETIPLANLSKVLLPLNATRLFVNAASQTVGARLMHENLWLPILIGLSLHGLTLPALLLIKDPRRTKHKPSAPRTIPTVKTTIITATDEVTEPLLATPNTVQPSDPKPEHPESSLRNALSISIFLLRDPITAPILAILFWNEIGHGVNNIVQQWVSKTFAWSLADTNYFLSSQRIVAGVTLVLLSATVHRMQAAGVSSQRIDFRIIWFSQCVTLIGIFGAAVSGLGGGSSSVRFVCFILVYMMGWGTVGALQSTVTNVIDRDHVTRVYVGLNIAERAASILSGPVFAHLLAEGLRRGGVWVYLPFYVSGAVFLVVWVLTMRLSSLLARL